MSKCLFCDNKNTGSDEHIIPDCINGRLHSKYIICQDCNAKFGKSIDPVIKEIFSQFLTIWGIKNGKGFQADSPEGTKYLISKKGTTSQVKPTVTVIKEDGKTEVRVVGEPKHAISLFEKKRKELLEKGYKEISITQKEGVSLQPPLYLNWKLETSAELILLLNKIAVEFYAYSGLPKDSIVDLCTKILELNKSIQNVLFCNFEEEIRKFENEETSHLVLIRNDKETETLFAYVELFNVICAVIPLVETYKGEDINFSYRQDFRSGERLDGDIASLDGISELLKSKEQHLEVGFGALTNKLTQRLRNQEFTEIYKAELGDIRDTLLVEVTEGKIIGDAFTEELIKRTTKMIAELSLFDFPYIVEDFKDEENDEVNYIHSNMNENQFDDFCKKNSQIIGMDINIIDEGEFVFASFYKQPFMKINGICLVSVFCVLKEKSTGRLQYIPYRYFFEGIDLVGNPAI